jgi:MSHA biogenesis protein MshP
MAVPLSSASSRRLAQAGVSGMLVMAALVLMGALSAYGVSLVTSVHTAFAQELSVARAAQAAEAGLEWARFRITRTPVAICPASQNLVLPATLSNYRATVTCTLTGTHTEGAATVRTYFVTSTGCNAAACPGAVNGDYVQRQVSGWVQR